MKFKMTIKIPQTQVQTGQHFSKYRTYIEPCSSMLFCLIVSDLYYLQITMVQARQLNWTTKLYFFPKRITPVSKRAHSSTIKLKTTMIFQVKLLLKRQKSSVTSLIRLPKKFETRTKLLVRDNTCQDVDEISKTITGYYIILEHSEIKRSLRVNITQYDKIFILK